MCKYFTVTNQKEITKIQKDLKPHLKNGYWKAVMDIFQEVVDFIQKFLIPPPPHPSTKGKEDHSKPLT